MDDLRFKGKWNQLKGKAKQKWANLTDDDLQYAEGKEDSFMVSYKRKPVKVKTKLNRGLTNKWMIWIKFFPGQFN